MPYQVQHPYASLVRVRRRLAPRGVVKIGDGVRRDYCKIEPCDVIQRPIDVVFAEEWKQIEFTGDFYS